MLLKGCSLEARTSHEIHILSKNPNYGVVQCSHTKSTHTNTENRHKITSDTRRLVELQNTVESTH